jgi:hypothetical protein
MPDQEQTSAKALADILPEWHPLLPSWDLDAATRVISRNGVAEYSRLLALRHQAARAALWDENQPLGTNPYQDTLELPHWADADFLLRADKSPAAIDAAAQAWRLAPYVERLPAPLRLELGRLPDETLGLTVNLLILLGGNRSGKSEYCSRRVVQSAMRHPGSLVLCISGEDMDQSRDNQQRLIWKYLPADLKALNGKRDTRGGIFHINYSRKGGFTLDKVILPNGSSILFFASGTQEPDTIQGKGPGHADHRCVGVWADESVRLPWMKAAQIRANYYNAIVLWSFTPIDGMTPAIKDLVGAARTLKALPAELMTQERRHVPDCPPGTMPYLQVPHTPQAAVLYFHTQLSPFGAGGRTFYEALKAQHEKSGDAIKARFAYGYTEDTTGRKFPGFTSANVVPARLIPEVGTIRRWADPHGSRPFAHWWTLTTPGDPPTHYVIREWPDEPTHGPWAVPAEKADATSNKWKDGERGPAQRPLGMGVTDYKKLWRDQERIPVPPALKLWARTIAASRAERDSGRGAGASAQRAALDALLKEHVPCPWHRPALRRALLAGGTLDELFEDVVECYFDPRFCNAEYADDEGTTCLRFKFEETHNDPDTGRPLPDCTITEAAGKDLEHGYGLITDLLAWDRSHPDGLIPGINAPRLYVAEHCTQTRWAFDNFTGLAKGEGASKEWMDLARWLAEADPIHFQENQWKIRSATEDNDE